MSRRHVTVQLTEHEASNLQSLLSMVLTNPDQWDAWDLRALERVSNKLEA